jgi:uncharacterized protein YjbI with pentapeptide repeats
MNQIRHRYADLVIAEGNKSVLELAQENKADLRNADLRGAYLRGADLRGANLYDANLCSADLRGADLRDANLYDANLCSADLRDANLCSADLCGADLRDANLCSANLRGADLRGADLRGADLRDAKYGDATLLKYLTIGPIGSRNDYLQVFITSNETIIKTGCFSGTLNDLAMRTERNDYQSAIPFIGAIIENVRAEFGEER